MADHPHPRLEARAYALLTSRRALSQTLAGLAPHQLWAAVGEGGRSLGEIARAAWEHEAYWLWPPEIPPPQIDERPHLEGVLYALVRHRGVTEDLLMRSSDDDLDRVYVSEARIREPDHPTTLGQILETVMREELFLAAEAATLRRLLDPRWPGAREAWDNAAEAIANSRRAG